MSSEKLSDSELPELVRLATLRDSQAVERLFTLLLPRVRNLVRYLVRGDQDVDDISQDALVMILRGLPTYRAEGNFYSWADRVVARLVFATLKRRQQTPTARPDGAPLARLESPTGTAGPTYVARRQLVAMMDQLPSEQREALALRYVLGFSVREIAEAWGLPEETVRSRLRLAKGRLRRMWQTDLESNGKPSQAARQMVG